MKKKEVSIETISTWIKSADWGARYAAMNACIGKNVPIEIIELGIKDEDIDVRFTATSVYMMRDIPFETIDCWLKDGDSRLRVSAMKYLKSKGLPVPLIRAIEPPDTVYKRCRDGVVVCATIPKDAQVRGCIDGKCRADKAVITDIIGSFLGEQVGLSSWDSKTTYFIGDEIEIENFDYSDKECSTGFHFFCTEKQAREYV